MCEKQPDSSDEGLFFTYRVLTEYGYDSAGQLMSVTYNDDTPDLVYSRDRLGRLVSVTRGNVTHAAYTYRADLQPDTETQQIDSLNKTITRTYQNGSGGTVAGRPTGYTFPNGSVAYTYDSAGRLSTVTDGTDTFNYGYTYTQATGGPRVGATTGNLKEDFMPYTLDGPRVDTTLEYDATRDALLSRANYLPSATLSKFSYAVNAIGQRTTLTPSGNAFTTITALNWGFDSLGQLTSANRGTASIFNRSYAYDDIGNRLAATHYNPTAVEDLTTSYYADKDENPLAGASALNQYARIIDPLLANPIDPVHDLDGNMTFGPVAGAGGLSIGMPAPAEAVLVWDAENRLIQATVDTIIVSYEYDHLGRLISRDDGTTVTRYLYDGFNRIAEYTGTTLAKVYLWGLDLSGTPQGAGGVGGLLSILDNASTIRYYPTYDGNGNVSEYINSTAGTQSAHFEYDPFGNLTVDSSTNAASFPYRFSTKPQDPVTGLYYYGYRYYDPLTGRWPSRDPIGENGGVNLYGFVGNDGIGAIDLLGLENPHADPTDPKHTPEACSEAVCCVENLRRLFRWMTAAETRRSNDFTDYWRTHGTEQSWTNHRQQFTDTLANCSSCAAIIFKQYIENQCIPRPPELNEFPEWMRRLDRLDDPGPFRVPVPFPIPSRRTGTSDAGDAAGAALAWGIVWRLAVGLADGPEPGPLDLVLWGSFAASQ